MNDPILATAAMAAAAPETVDRMVATLTDFASVYGLRVIGAVLILIIGRIVAGQARRGVRKLGDARRWDASLTGFVSSLVYFLVMAFVFIALPGS